MTDNANNDPIGKALNLQPMFSSASTTVNNLLAKAHDDSARSDFETARANLIDMIETGQASLIVLSEIAKSSQHPRAFEVMAKMMDTLTQANKDLLELQKKIREIDAADTPMNEKAQTVNNNLFVGSTAELQKMIEKMRNGGTE